ncbi:MAG: DUF4168 domain-containing protein [Cyanothece sp. SIO1E1]|nr:DUF4168 domain-containing protein [Cyanothece sp. SIO1E1]
MNFARHCFFIKPPYPLSRFLLILILSAVNVLFSPSTRFQEPIPRLVFNPVAQAQSFTDEEVQHYAEAIWQIEQLRLVAYNQVERITGDDSLAAIACHRADSIAGLPRSARKIIVDYCRQSIQVVRQHNLNVRRFNAITNAQSSNPDLVNRIQTQLREIQKTAPIEE